MKTTFVWFGALFLVQAATAGLIPQPVSVETRPGEFRLQARTTIVAPAEARQVASYLAGVLAPPTGWQHKVSELVRRNAIVLALAPGDRPEGYELVVTPRGVRIQSPTPAGLFYGVQTLLQLLPPEIESQTRREAAWTVPCVHIVDYPRFAWRGLMLDVSRHFFSKEFVKQYIDRMARYKMNVFHWHLTDDNGWRIEIKGLPQLTQVGAWRVPRLARWGTREAPREGEAATDGGFYTQDDIREVVAYAKQRFVTVVPEIEMPGHSLAALAAYPELSCTGGPFQVNPGSNFYEKVDNAFCPGNEKTFEFIDKVFSEVAPLFPSEYVHIGGDECFKGFWKTCAKCQRRMADEHLTNVEELQSYLVRRAEKILESKGKKLIGWDEILEGGLAPNAAVMSWRGMEGGIAAAKMNHQVVMTPDQLRLPGLLSGRPVARTQHFRAAAAEHLLPFRAHARGSGPQVHTGRTGQPVDRICAHPQACRVHDLAAGPGAGRGLLVAQSEPELGRLCRPGGDAIPALGRGAGELRAHHVRRGRDGGAGRGRKAGRAHDDGAERLRHLLHVRWHQPGLVHGEILRRAGGDSGRRFGGEGDCVARGACVGAGGYAGG